MRPRTRWTRASFLIGLLGIGLAALSLQCSWTDDESVDIVTKCDTSKLDIASTAESTVKVYVDTGAQLKTRATQLLERFKVVCNAMNKDLGLPEGADVHAACNAVAERVATADKIGVVNGAPVGTFGSTFGSPWVFAIIDDSCASDSATEAKCLDSCSGAAGCDVVKGCTKLTGTCPGKCTGTCVTAGPSVPCAGACIGQCSAPAPPDAPEAGVPACYFPDGRECVGKCLVPFWQGRCTTGCNAEFRGTCSGKCTGSCDDVAYPRVADPDAGMVDAGMVDASPGDAGPSGAPGSGMCNGVCTGACDGPSSGSCGAGCDGDFAGGGCPVCVGSCTGIAIPCTTTCTGACIQATSDCKGECSACDVPFVNPKCAGASICGPDGGGGGDANPICKNVCKMQGALAAKCGKDPSPSIQVAGDYKLYDVLRAHLTDFSEMVRELNLIAANLGGVTQRTPGEFKAIGVTFDNPRKCVEGASADYEAARKSINEAIGASLVIRGAKF